MTARKETDNKILNLDRCLSGRGAFVFLRKLFPFLGCSFFLLLQVQVKAQPGSDLLDSAREMFYAGNYEAAETLLRISLNKEDQGGARYAVCLQNLALIEYLNFHFSESEKLYLQAISIAESSYGKDSLSVANNLYGLSRCLRRSNRLHEAEGCLSRILEIRTKQLGAEHRLVSNTLFDLAVNCCRQGKHAEAEPLYAQTLGLREKERGKNAASLRPLLDSYAQCVRQTANQSKVSELEERIRNLDEPKSAVVHESKQDDGSSWQSNFYSQP